MRQQFIYVTLQKEFIHQYKDAPDEVSYLRFPHRHIAHIKVKVQVFHNEREIEFIMLKHRIQDMLNEVIALTTPSNCSCETIANEILDWVIEHYGDNRIISVIVSEDDENGCEVVYRTEEEEDK